jgi:CrcB protein
MFTTLLVFLGAGIGGSLRHGVNLACGRWCGTDFPVATLVINIAGCFCMGLIAGWFAFRSGGGQQPLRLFLTTGILGGFTTFSAFSLDTALLWERGQSASAALYVFASIILSIAACFGGLALIRSGT